MDDKALLNIYTGHLINASGFSMRIGSFPVLDGPSTMILSAISGKFSPSGKHLWENRQFMRASSSDWWWHCLWGRQHLGETIHGREEMICWYHDHVSAQTDKGINFITSLYHVNRVSLMGNLHLAETIEFYADNKLARRNTFRRQK